MRSRLAVQSGLAIAALVPVSAGLWGVFFAGEIAVGGSASHGRYLSGLLLAIGLGFWSVLPDLEKRAARVRLLTALVVIGGLCRLLGVMLGDRLSLPTAGALAMELVVTPLLCLWQARLAASVTRRGLPP